ncbi:MAG: hypothetical protein V4692_16760 [Bdellovibrionota bacterium]
MILKAALTVSVALSGSFAQAQLCSSWAAPKTIGHIDTTVIPEASGLAISSHFSERLYHVNDRGNVPVVFVSNFAGKIQQKITVPGLKAGADTESMGYGPCESASKTCIFVGDIGDNDRARATIDLAWFEEKETFDGPAKLIGHISMKYPQGANNAEGFFVHPNGDVFIFTKELKKASKKSGAEDEEGPSTVYRLKASDVAKAKGTFTLEKVGVIDVPALIGNASKESKVVTGASASSDGRILLLTYGAALEILFTPGQMLKSTKSMKQGSDYNIIKLDLPHQEAIEFLPDSSGFIVTSEKKKKSPEAPIVEVKCRS